MLLGTLSFAIRHKSLVFESCLLKTRIVVKKIHKFIFNDSKNWHSEFHKNVSKLHYKKMLVIQKDKDILDSCACYLSVLKFVVMLCLVFCFENKVFVDPSSVS